MNTSKFTERRISCIRDAENFMILRKEAVEVTE